MRALVWMDDMILFAVVVSEMKSDALLHAMSGTGTNSAALALKPLPAKQCCH